MGRADFRSVLNARPSVADTIILFLNNSAPSALDPSAVLGLL